MKTFKVATFYHGDDLRRSHIATYTRDFHPDWFGCVVYDVEAGSVHEARKIAVERRLGEERMLKESRHAEAMNAAVRDYMGKCDGHQKK